ncbi:MAG: NAD-dependent epimerase/dehydratase family protein [Actinomycetota bacterium]|nr:NAD-dependent epimerase/dehydratase family protein [Actinomycetota bacterium]
MTVTGASSAGGRGRVLVVGASGLVGRAAVERFAAAGWDVVAMSRRRPTGLDGVEHRAVDLTDADECAAAVADLADVTHVVYAAVAERPGLFEGWVDDELIERNATMAANLFDPLVDAAPGLRHVSLLHGTKAYGLHHPSLRDHSIDLPLRERMPVRPHPNFYFRQEQHLRSLRDRGATFSLTMFRPTFVYGTAAGVNMNPLLAIAVYGAILRELGEPLHFPGAAPDLLREAVDASLLADALVWAADVADGQHGDAVDGEAFNVTNGDLFTWTGAWPMIADALGMAVGEARPTLLTTWLAEHADVWASMVDRSGSGLPKDVAAYVGENSIRYADLVLGSLGVGDRPIVNSTIKLRHAGFAGCIDSLDMFDTLVRRLATEGALPPP